MTKLETEIHQIIVGVSGGTPVHHTDFESLSISIAEVAKRYIEKAFYRGYAEPTGFKEEIEESLKEWFKEQDL